MHPVADHYLSACCRRLGCVVFFIKKERGNKISVVATKFQWIRRVQPKSKSLYMQDVDRNYMRKRNHSYFPLVGMRKNMHTMVHKSMCLGVCVAGLAKHGGFRLRMRYHCRACVIARKEMQKRGLADWQRDLSKNRSNWHTKRGACTQVQLDYFIQLEHLSLCIFFSDSCALRVQQIFSL